ncbi:cation-translocating P-type ATPase [Pelotomaculum terephthalicicum JT]|uniref:cation-translocating P-type ATPase n=2 Tax=Pelotomaculum TaxID=191373 RepID=UPI0009CAC7BB|nr:cation-translocating P-type ATPase [Pelotomaculum terephthalicicum]MCG9967338.1 cation-translocating P-type ATPase [Pelotomaculum terephthalicicum JT]OPY61313.1 MAG: Calcium-transporting ATPase 1 [Pelotomaculum sp. PtaU1.Bin065]
MQNLHNKTADQVLALLNADINGLNDRDVNRIRSEYGYNELKETKKKSVFSVFFSQFTDFLVIILLVAALVSIFLRDYESAVVIIAVTILNAFLGTVQHVKAERSLESLKALASPLARVLRNGYKVEIPSREVVVGDIMYLEAGDYVSADCRIIENHSLQANESSLTGESVSVAKSDEKIDAVEVPVADRKNMAFTGSLITYGRAVAVVTATGMHTELGKIASLLETAKEKLTPLQVSLDAFGKKLAFVIIGLCAIIFVINVVRDYGLGESFMFAVALAVAAIPEALSSIVTIVLAIGTQKMAKENAIIRKLQAVESLGSVSVICSDKTGTLTQNKMVVSKIHVAGNTVSAKELDLNHPLTRDLVEMSVLCNDAVTQNGQSIGDPTEVALNDMAARYDLAEAAIRSASPRIAELPFDSDRKMMSTLHERKGRLFMITKGAFDVIIKRSKSIAAPAGARTATRQDLDGMEQVNLNLSREGLRILAIAYKVIEDRRELMLSDEDGLTLLGLVAMIDPPREESAKAVMDCVKAGIKPVMITGDHKITASAIAREIGILKDEKEAMEGYELDKLTDEQLSSAINNISVYARVSPEHKIRIVKAWQEKGLVVAMTGDGVNDAPALKQANIGIAMGKVGTEVAKEASDMVLTDDNFATIVKAVSNGRSIYTNIKNSIKFLLSGNMAGILAVLYTSVAHLPLPFTAVHLLFINLLTDSMPAIALGLEPHNKDTMSEKPRNINEPILTKNFLAKIFLEGAVIAASTIAAFYYGLYKEGVGLGSTMAFSTLSLARLFHGLNCRSRLPLYKIGIFTNKYQWAALFIGAALLTTALIVPAFQGIFDVYPAIKNELHLVAGFALIPLVVIQLYKTTAAALNKRRFAKLLSNEQN